MKNTKAILIAIGAFLLGMLCMLIITRGASAKAEKVAGVQETVEAVEQAEETKPDATPVPVPTKTPEPEESPEPQETQKPENNSASTWGNTKPASTPTPTAAPVEQDAGFEGEETPLVEPGDILLPEA